MNSLRSLWKPGVVKVLIALALLWQMYAFSVQQNEQREERSQISIRVCDPTRPEEEIKTVGTFGAHVVCGQAPSNLRGRGGVSVVVTGPKGAPVDVAMITWGGDAELAGYSEYTATVEPLFRTGPGEYALEFVIGREVYATTRFEAVHGR